MPVDREKPFTYKTKSILEEKRYDVQKALSDLNGTDIKSHNNDPERTVQALHHWLIETVGMRDIDSPSVIWDRFNEFSYDFLCTRKAQGYSRNDLKMMPIPEYIKFIKLWLNSDLSD